MNETLNYLGKLSGNSLISGTCLAADGISGFAQVAAFPILLCARPFINLAERERGEIDWESKREIEGEVQLWPCNFVADALLSRTYIAI